MADKVLTTSSKVTCTHGAEVKFVSEATLQVGGSPVVRIADLVGATIPSCPANTKCVKIATPPSASILLRDGGSEVVLVTSLATNNGPCTVTDSGHDLLKAD